MVYCPFTKRKMVHSSLVDTQVRNFQGGWEVDLHTRMKRVLWLISSKKVCQLCEKATKKHGSIHDLIYMDHLSPPPPQYQIARRAKTSQKHHIVSEFQLPTMHNNMLKQLGGLGHVLCEGRKNGGNSLKICITIIPTKESKHVLL